MRESDGSRRNALLVTASVVVLGLACDPGGFESRVEPLLVTDRCVVRGAGALASGDELAGEVRGGDLGASGTWSHAGEAVVGEAQWIVCRINGALLADFGGAATVEGRSGYTFRVGVQDFGPPADGELLEGATEVQTVVASRTYRPTRWEDGEVRIEHLARVTIPSSLPVSVGNAGNQWAWLTFERHGSEDVVSCRYRGAASTPNPSAPAELAAGLRYELERCTGTADGALPIRGGDRVEVRWMRLRVQTGAHLLPTRECPRTEVTLALEVTPLLDAGPIRDRYRLAVWDDATGERVVLRDGELASGDLTVEPRD